MDFRDLNFNASLLSNLMALFLTKANFLAEGEISVSQNIYRFIERI
jgi:hypothetical protein